MSIVAWFRRFFERYPDRIGPMVSRAEDVHANSIPLTATRCSKCGLPDDCDYRGHTSTSCSWGTTGCRKKHAITDQEIWDGVELGGIGTPFRDSISNPTLNIKVFIVEGKRGEFSHFQVKIGEWEDKVPFKFLLKSELPKLEELLKRAQAAR